MPIATRYPGVYIDEDASPAISVNALPTAVPLFAMSYTNTSTTPVKFNSYLDVLQYYKASDLDTIAVRGLRAYFECGGGPCWAVDWDVLAKAADELGDAITLIVQNTFDDVAPNPSDTRHFFLLDGPTTEITDGTANSAYTANPYAAVYYPTIVVPWSQGYVPASAIMAGLYCKNDSTRGVWNAPANMLLPTGYQPSYPMTDSLQAQYNSRKAINMIRSFPNRGTVVWGARTLDNSDNWRYINVRRLFNSTERDISSAMRKMVFEPNNQPTWRKIYTAIDSYLYSLWQQGALVGVKPEDAYFVQIGEGVTMTADDIAQGKMIAKVGMAAVRPAEFIIIEFTQDMQSVTA
ncbi:phage tail sheath family protein [Pararobbsia silviterrae]|uniref:Phage tail sheath family protein n=1 Tax=Pararobbsia silviterrae TaxID=1792498 RepID=A0A494Y3J1_9BURK|nr:phage tail sheath C-terminal domain-containing protein [Pararobbsia silviterrae]RKP56023.1 phage tail sheath family protein [Pararobbsia silviterrae]